MLSFPMARKANAHIIQETQPMYIFTKKHIVIINGFAAGVAVPCRIASAGSD
jgi:hypothetical protein